MESVDRYLDFSRWSSSVYKKAPKEQEKMPLDSIWS